MGMRKVRVAALTRPLAWPATNRSRSTKVR